jgi:ribosomal protein L16 Arg81 hydroxylase
MNEILNEKEFLEEIKSKMTIINDAMGEVFDLIIERVTYKKALVTKFEESIKEYEYEPEIATNEEIKRVEQFSEVVKEIIGI